MNKLVKVVKTFKDGQAPGLESLPMSTVKKSFNFIRETLLHISACLGRFCHVATWLKANKLFIDVKKKIIIFRTKTELSASDKPFQNDKTIIEEVEHIKLLGVYIHQHLAGKCILTSFVQKFLKQQECCMKQGFMHLANPSSYCIILLPLAILSNH